MSVVGEFIEDTLDFFEELGHAVIGGPTDQEIEFAEKEAAAAEAQRKAEEEALRQEQREQARLRRRTILTDPEGLGGINDIRLG